MGRIRVLDDVLANQIAAGEVVERPASVAKELLENAVDAGATAITVEIADGGVGLLRVVDDGHGMDADDARLALQRHATSKVATASDLHHIRTLGFRGEALPSIASVSRLTLRTRQPGALGATQIRVEGGREVEARDAPGPVGTEMRVEDLFYNVPARRKFLKRGATEASHVQEAVQRLALCYPEVAFRFVKDGRVAFDLPRHATLLDRVRAIFGATAASRLTPVRVDGAFGLDGLIGPPDEARSTGRHYHTFINGRFVRDRVVMSAVQSAYGGRLDRSRHPFVVLRIHMPPEALDVNVHPAKTEVRFVESGGVHRLVAGAIERALRDDPWSAPGEGEAAPARTFQLGGGATSEDGDGADGEAGAGEAGGLAGHRQRIFDAMERITARRTGLGGGQRAAYVAPREAQLDLGVTASPPPLRLRPSSGGATRVELIRPPTWAGRPDNLSSEIPEGGSMAMTSPDAPDDIPPFDPDTLPAMPEATAYGFDDAPVARAPTADAAHPGETRPAAGGGDTGPAAAARHAAATADDALPHPAAIARHAAAAADYALPRPPSAEPERRPAGEPRPARASRPRPAPPPLPALGKRPDLAALPFAALRPLGPLGAGLLLCAAADALVGVDVAVARRRVCYAALRKGAGGEALARPVSVELDADERARWATRAEALRGLGFAIEPFGGATHVIERVPAGLAPTRAEATLRALLAAEADDADQLPATLAAAAADAMVDDAPIEPAEAAALLAALAAADEAPPRSGSLAFVLTEAELRRKLGGR
ncbi:MAG: DNA mismatch repair endonuclease MutL [bacterium]